MRGRDTPVLFRIEHLAFRSAIGVLGTLSHAGARRFGRRLGTVGWATLGRHRRIALDNLEHRLPELNLDHRRRVARSSFESLGMAACEVISATRMDGAEIGRRFSVEGLEILDSVDAEDRGVLFVGCHHGAWQLAPLILGRRYGGISLVARPPENPLIEADVLPMWERFGNRVLDREGVSRKIYTAVRERGRVATLIDNRIRQKEGAIKLSFFNEKAWTSPIAAFVAIRTGALTIPVSCKAINDDHYVVRIDPPIRPEGHSVETLTSRYLQWAEDQIRRDPGMWMWMHRRWREDE